MDGPNYAKENISTSEYKKTCNFLFLTNAHQDSKVVRLPFVCLFVCTLLFNEDILVGLKWHDCFYCIHLNINFENYGSWHAGEIIVR